MSIIFYSMGNSCGFCIKAQELLKKEIEDGTVVVLESSEANGRFIGFPSFENKENGKTHTGLPPSKKELFRILEVNEDFVSEGYEENKSDENKSDENKSDENKSGEDMKIGVL